MTLTATCWQRGYIIIKRGEITGVNFGFGFDNEITISVDVHIISLSICGNAG
jgi:hypothetical protein